MRKTSILLALIVTLSHAGDIDSMSTLPEIRSIWNFSDPAESESKFRDLYAKALTLGEATYALEVRTQIARTHSLRSQFDQAHSILDTIERDLEKTSDRVRVRYLLERGRTFHSSGKAEIAEPLFIEAWEIARGAKEDSLAVDAAHMVAIACATDQQIAWNRKAIELAESSEDPQARNWIGSLTNNLGWTHYDLGQFDDALDMFDRSLSFFGERDLEPQARIARWSRAKTLRALGRVEEALSIQKDLLAEYEGSGEEDGYVFEEIGECLLSAERTEDARPYFKKAYEILSKDPWLVENESERMERLRGLGGDP